MSKVIIDIKNTDIAKFQDGDLLMYNASQDQFYRVSSEKFLEDFEKKLFSLGKKYDEKLKQIQDEKNEIRNDFENLKESMNGFVKDLTEKNQKINDKLITMVENFVTKEGDN